MKPADTQNAALQHAIQLDADSCVMCGMCLPHCPTYQVYRNESESPRGRIAIAQACAQGRLQPDEAMLQHLDHCLGCMACEAMCPSNVAYGRLIDNAQAMLANERTRQRKQLSLLLSQTRHKGGLSRYSNILRWYNTSGLQKFAGKALAVAGNSAAVEANRILGLAQAERLESYYPAAGKALGDIALFTGCMGASFDASTLLSAIKLLTRFGYNLYIPAAQHCCGALHQHHGQLQQARQLTEQNQQLFGKLPVSHIIYTANGCGAQLNQSDMPVPVIDILSFLLASPALTKARFQPLTESVLIHESCSTGNKLKIGDIMNQILQHIPQLQIVKPQTPTLCCGAGSSHQLLFPDLAEALLQEKIQRIKEIQPKYLLSDNLGCALHFKNGIKKSGLDIKVIHPITLLAMQLD